MKQVKNVVIINDFNYVNGGAAKVAIDTAEILAKEGINVYFYSAVYKDTELKDNVKYITTNQKEALQDNNRIRGIINGIYNFKAKKELKKLLETLNNENTIIHVHGWMKALSSSIFSIIHKKKFCCVVTFHDYFSMCPNGGFYNYKQNEICHLKPLSKKCIKCNCDSRNYLFKIYRVIRQFVQNNIVRINDKIKYIISISDFSYNILKEGIRKDAIIKHINNPIDIQKEEKIEPKKNDYFLYVGRVSKEKGVDLFCEVIEKLHYKGIVVGDGNQLLYLKQQYPNIDFTGWKNKNEVYEYMKHARALIFPSLWYEGAPLTILEAMSIGLPCLVSDASAAIEFIENNTNGLVFKSKNMENMLENFHKLNDDKTLSNLSKNAYDYFYKMDFGENRYKNEIINYYNQILNDV